MNYHLKSKRHNYRQSSVRSFITTPFGLLIIFLFIIIVIFHSFFSGLLFTVIEPFFSTRNALVERFVTFKQELKEKSDLINQNDALSKELTLAKIRLSEFEALQAENESLKSFGLHASSTVDSKKIFSRVLANPALTPYDTIVIDSGADKGIVVGSEVRVWGDKLIGFVSDVFPSSSIVVLLSSPDKKTEVRIGSSTPATAYGRGAGNFLMTIPKEAPGEIGDRVFMSLYGQTIGMVSAVESDETESMKRLYVSFPFSVFTLDWVTVNPPRSIVLESKNTATSTVTVIGTTTKKPK